MISSTDPTRWARWIVWMASNSSATSPSFSERTCSVSVARSERKAAAWSGAADPTCSRIATTRGSLSVRIFTSRANTVAAAGAPPITEANDPSTAATSIVSLSFLENTTKAPPW